MESVKERILAFIIAKEISKSAFEKSVGLSNGYLNSLRHTPGNDKLSRILEAFPELNKTWLLSGEGEMFIKDNEQKLEDIIFEIASIKRKIALFENTLRNHGLL